MKDKIVVRRPETIYRAHGSMIAGEIELTIEAEKDAELLLVDVALV